MREVTGWLAPDGRLERCAWHAHRTAAVALVLAHRLPHAPGREDDALLAAGWARVGMSRGEVLVQAQRAGGLTDAQCSWLLALDLPLAPDTLLDLEDARAER